MAKPPKLDRPMKKNISLPTSLVAKVELLLYSEAEKRVPQGAWQAVVTELLERWLAERGIAR